MSIRVYALHRVEPISRQGDPGRGLAAPVHDPLWGLARQRHFGELAGEDTGSPIQVSVRMRVDRLDGWRPVDTDDVLPYDPDRDVLEAVVAGESAAPAPGLRDRVDAGRRLAALLPAATVSDLRDSAPIEVGPDAPRLLARAAARYPDGIQVAAAYDGVAGDSDDAVGTALGTTAARASQARPVLDEYAAWVRTTFGTGPATWMPERLERRFELSTGGHVVLTAPAHTRDTVDALDLDLTEAAHELQAWPTPTAGEWHRRIPSRLSFPGMPNNRFWEFEDAQIALHRIDAATHDLARLALVEFSATYGNDWFTFPIPAEHGTVATVPEVLVRDTFGEHELVHVANDPTWSMFVPSGPASAPHLLVAPVTVSRLAGQVVEEVRFVRDENANLVWGLEAVVTDAAGVTHDVIGEYAASAAPVPELPVDAELLYRLMTDVPKHWVPFIPAHLDEDREGLEHVEQERRAVGLVQALLPRPDTWGIPVLTAPRSSVLAELRQKVLCEEEVGPAGVTVRRRWYLARSADGGRHVWCARSVATGRGEGNSGLAFDVALDVRGT
ncbi:hypothetical protein DDE18_21055 [Nocardioides gansuensis]|uniref:Uncharacterized protein n=1 Tax=Nocardioides gansuensis TaxID=2138300 RepID=A0A2T8F596_9ACTN|nr:hypothetical protein [Nocardioides gansuensis]PVG80873.1 hypothetical protein DDE18_21055 [Nocardioides gansuensis]